ncbi:hypothetical protein HK097_003586 [Rhizophlyctis rosea]|uniref:Uncharacterized protein n=1 Tax=Rhizophlyctis rosea TaxID=64517 RepID=A0AAD5WZH8_9FUNG|nr:hypothetical protein HK097_003586 [Rhizophlyctis rosea]
MGNTSNTTLLHRLSGSFHRKTAENTSPRPSRSLPRVTAQFSQAIIIPADDPDVTYIDCLDSSTSLISPGSDAILSSPITPAALHNRVSALRSSDVQTDSPVSSPGERTPLQSSVAATSSPASTKYFGSSAPSEAFSFSRTHSTGMTARPLSFADTHCDDQAKRYLEAISAAEMLGNYPPMSEIVQSTTEVGAVVVPKVNKWRAARQMRKIGSF